MKKYLSIQNLLKSLVIVLITVFSVNISRAQQPDTKGTDFWLAFPGNYGGYSSLYFYISGETATTGTVTASGFSDTFSVTPGTVTIVSVPTSFNISSHNLVETKGIHITANDEITIYGLNQYPFTTDAYVALPTDILGTDYIALNYTPNLPSQLTIVATEDSTSVTITSTLTVSGFTAGVPSTITLNQGQTFQIRSSDGTGSLITSDKPIGLFGGSECTNIPSGSYYACDHIVEMIPPVSTWGKNFVVMPLATRTGSTYRILASEDSTSVTINGSLDATLNKGQFYQTTRTAALHITTDKPVLVGQYAHSSSYDGAIADPFFMIIPPYEQYLGSYTVATPGTGFTSHWINVVVPAAAVGEAEVDGSAIPAGSFSAIGSSGFYGATIEVTNGTHTINSNFPIGTHMYGWGDYDSYGYPGGASLAPVAFVDDLDVSPTSATLDQYAQHCITATVTDNNGDPVEGIRVDFAVTGANITGGFANTDSNGEATFCYTDTVGGSDSIEVSTGSLTEYATVDFTATPCGSDTTAPIAKTQDITVYLDSTGTATITVAQIDSGSTDDCAIDTMYLDITSFNCSDTGANTVTLIVKDVAGNVDSATAIVTVISTLTADAGSDDTVYYGYSPMASTTLSGQGAYGGGTYSYAWSTGDSTQSITVSPTSTTTYTLTVTDSNGCTATDQVTVYVVDVRCGKKMDKVAMCHNGNQICIATSAVASHLANHSDCYLGPCQSSGKRDFGFTEEDDEAVQGEEEILSSTSSFNVYPNPFIGNTTLQFSVATDQRISVGIYDIKGSLVQSIYEGDVRAGVLYKVAVDATQLPSNMYFARFVSGNEVQNIKIVQIK
ncbi:MAG: Ig-like domain-containing protein [Bacteroidia bacterium]